MGVTGATLPERQAKRAAASAKTRARHYAHRIRTAPTAARGLAEACDYLRAVAADLPVATQRRLTRAVVDLADRKGES